MVIFLHTCMNTSSLYTYFLLCFICKIYIYEVLLQVTDGSVSSHFYLIQNNIND
jgi:hypothetical protein